MVRATAAGGRGGPRRGRRPGRAGPGAGAGAPHGRWSRVRGREGVGSRAGWTQIRGGADSGKYRQRSQRHWDQEWKGGTGRGKGIVRQKVG